MSEQVCMTGAEYCGGAVGVDAGVIKDKIKKAGYEVAG